MKTIYLLLPMTLALSSFANAQSDRSRSTVDSSLKNHPRRSMEGSDPAQSITRENLREELRVPNLVGENVNRIGFKNALKQGFRAKVSHEKDGTGLPKGQIISQDPKAGSQLQKATEIHLTVSSGQ